MKITKRWNNNINNVITSLFFFLFRILKQTKKEPTRNLNNLSLSILHFLSLSFSKRSTKKTEKLENRQTSQKTWWNCYLLFVFKLLIHTVTNIFISQSKKERTNTRNKKIHDNFQPVYWPKPIAVFIAINHINYLFSLVIWWWSK